MTSHDYQHNERLRKKIRTRLSRFATLRLDTSDAGGKALIGAAVVLTVSKQTNANIACIYVTRRSSKLRKHAGQYALPGGKIDFGESTKQAALRELSEELGLSIDQSQVLGVLDDIPTRSGFMITPVVVWNNLTSPPKPNPDEVAEVFEIPLTELVSPTLVSLEETATTPIISIYTPAIGHDMYSPTAAIIYQFREVALLGNETRVSHYEQPAFAWR